MDKVLVVDDLDVTFALHKAEVKAVSDLDFSLSAGETWAVNTTSSAMTFTR